MIHKRKLMTCQIEPETFQNEVVPFDLELIHSSLEFCDQIPDKYRATVEDGFTQADEDIFHIAKIFSSDLRAIHSTLFKAVISNGSLVKPVSHYDPVDNCIYMDESKSEEEYMRTFRHEYGHFIDFSLGVISESSEFIKAFEEDAQLYDASKEYGIRRLRELQTEIAENIHAFSSEYVTDIISALTHNDTRFITKYIENATQTSPDASFYFERTEGAGMSGHSNLYWDDGPYMSRQKEAFANLFAIRVENNSIVLEFVYAHFPNLSSVFDSIVRSVDTK